ncbi:MAG: DUF952 domain-containing protein [Hamadaea sp.]|nr:DUF952 domain-containing protein [Hamadaea sp.]
MIYKLALPADWAAAQATGSYTTSTRGVSLEEEGFLHASRDLDQAEGVRLRRYADVEDLLLLVIDDTLLDAEVRWEGSAELFPHIYGPLPVSAVVEVKPYPMPDAPGA